MINLSIRKKIGVLLSAMTVAVIIFIFLSQYNLNHLYNGNIKIEKKDLIILTEVHNLKFYNTQVQQWLTDISATRGRDGLNDGFDLARDYSEKFKTTLKKLSKIDPENQKQYSSLLPKFENYYVHGVKMAEGYVNSGPTVGNQLMGNFDKAAESINDALAKLVNTIELSVSNHTFHQSTIVTPAN